MNALEYSVGAAAADNMASGQMGIQGPSANESIPFERYCKIAGAMQAWSKQGSPPIRTSVLQGFAMRRIVPLNFAQNTLFASKESATTSSSFSASALLPLPHPAVREQ